MELAGIIGCINDRASCKFVAYKIGTVNMNLMGKTVSILGDSISTYAGYNPEGYAVYYDESYQTQTRLTDVSMTWWYRVITFLGGRLCQNNSYSGSWVSGNKFPSGTSMERIQGLRKEDEEPGIILVYLGMNDYGYGVPVKPPSEGLYDDASYFAPSYDKMLCLLRETYPESKILCGTLMKARMKEYDGWQFPSKYHGNVFEDYNKGIRDSCRKNGCLLMDLASNDVRYESLDGAHPNDVGHKEMADEWIRCILETGCIPNE